MLSFDQTQFEALECERELVYQDELLLYFCGHFRERTIKLSDDALRSVIAEALVRARRIGVTSANILLLYVSMAVLVDPGFDQLAETRRMLDAPGFDPEYKVQLLADLLIARLDRV